MKASEQLKLATREAHNDLEQTDKLQQLFNPNLTQSEYAEIVSGFYALFNSLEVKLNRFSVCAEMGYSKRAPDLKQDLETLRWSENDIQLIATKCTLPITNSAAQAIGVAYVLQGSKNGSLFIRKHLLKNSLLIKSLENAMCFLSTGELPLIRSEWQSFLNQMDRYFERQSDSAFEEALQSANETFYAFKQQFS